MANRFSNDSFSVMRTGPVTTIMNGIVSLDVSLNTTSVAPAGGNAFDDLHNVVTQTPEIAISTESMAGVLNTVNFINGLCLTNPGGIDGLIVFTQAHDNCGAVPRIATQSSQAQMEHGRILIESITASPGANAILTFRAHGASDTGTVEPIVWTHGSITLPTIDAVYKNTMWSLGKVVVNGTVIDRVTSVNISYNHTVLKPISYASVWPKEVSVTKTSPTITITTEDVSLIKPGPYTSGSGLPVTHANTSIQFRKRSDNGGFVADGTAEHIKLTAAGTAFVRQVYTASGAATGTSTIGINTVDDGTNNPLVWDTAIAYVP